MHGQGFKIWGVMDQKNIESFVSQKASGREKYNSRQQHKILYNISIYLKKAATLTDQ